MFLRLNLTTLFLFFLISNVKAQFTAGNLVVLQAGDGTSTLSGTGNAIVLREFNILGMPTASVALPAVGNNAVIIRGNTQSEGYLSRSGDSNFLVFGVYRQSLPNSIVLNTSGASTINRAVVLVDASANMSIAATATSAALASGDIRSATASNSLNLWANSSSQGTSYYGNASSPSNVQNAKGNVRAAHIFNNQLYISSQVSSGTPTDIGVYSVGSGTPSSAAQTLSTLINAGTGALPGQFYFNAANTICYLADARNTAAGGIQKWILASGTWSLTYTLPTGTAAIGAFGVVADFSGPIPKVYATTVESNANRLVAILDNGPGATATTIATASQSNTAFRGLAWSPGTYTCIPVSVLSTTNNAPVCANQSLVIQVNAAGSQPISYAWTGAGIFSSTTVATPTITNGASGTYAVLLSNACGTAVAAMQLSVHPTPTLLVNAPTICSGGIATVNVSGANTYTWNNISNVQSFTAAPLVTTIYTVAGTSAAGCVANTVTTAITVVASPDLIVNNAVVCAGNTATLLAQGCSTYTWLNTSNNGPLLSVNPNTTTQYTVVANASGCANTVSATATVSVNALPNLSMTVQKRDFCKDEMSSILTATPLGGKFSGPFVTGNLFNPTAIGQYSIVYSYTNTNNCYSTCVEVFTVNACLATTNYNIHQGLSVFPNPASNLLFINSPEPLECLEVFDVYGRKQLTVKYDCNWSSLDISQLPSGLYFLTINRYHHSITRFIKE